MIALYIEDTPQLISLVEESEEKEDFVQVKAHAHKLKGASKNIGAESIALLSRHIEVLSDKEEKAALIDCIEQMRSQFDEFNCLIHS